MFFVNFSYGDSVYNSLNYKLNENEGVVWEPEQGIYNSSIRVNLSSQIGKIYYLATDNLSEYEPILFKDDLFLPGEDGRVVDYNISVMLEKNSGSIEFFSRTYRIDRLNKIDMLEKDRDAIKKDDKKSTLFKKDRNKIYLDGEFTNKEYSIYNRDREFVYTLKNSNTKLDNFEIVGEYGKKNIYLTAITHKQNNKITTEIKNNTIDLQKPSKPDFGSLYWGQTYRQEDHITIRSDSPYDKIYYWYSEKQKDEFIFGPPDPKELSRWTLYDKPILLESKYGLDGTIGLAAFAIGKNGIFSDISGPFYIKANGIENPDRQVFKEATNNTDDTKEDSLKEKKITINDIIINGEESNKNKLINLGINAILKFENFNEEDFFYFSFESTQASGKSELLPCDGEYKFSNSEEEMVNFSLFFSNGEPIANFTLSYDNFILPKLKNYNSYNIDLSHDANIEFFMPQNRVKYEITNNINHSLYLTKESNEFNGTFDLSANLGEEKLYKLKFGAFDQNNNLLKESNYYYFRIDKKKPLYEVESNGVDFNYTQNEMQTLKLSSKDSEARIFYRFDETKEWIPYTDPIIFYPPQFGESSIKIYCMSKDRVGNTRINEDPYILRFDRRGLFVNTTQKFSGNGTYSYPLNSLERAIYFAKRKKLKLIYLISEEINHFLPIQVETDVVIQPYNNKNSVFINMETRSLFKKNHVWFDIGKGGYLEIRNIDFNLKSGNTFVNLNNNKFKIYNSNISYSGKENFTFFTLFGGKIGMSNISINAVDNQSYLSFIDAKDGYCIINDLKAKVNCSDLTFFNLANNKKFIFENNKNINIDVTVNGVSKFVNSASSNINLKNIIYSQKGSYKNTNLFDIKNSNLDLNSSDFILEGENAFETKVFEITNSKLNVENGVIKVDKSFSAMGFNVINSELTFTKSMIEMANIVDYIYTFRLFNSRIKLNTSVIRNSGATSSVVFLLNNSNFQGVNNSIFNDKIKEKSFNFWINSYGEIETVNSLYYSSDNKKENKFIYINNNSFIKPNWLSNVVSDGMTLIENLNYSDSELFLNDFYEKNIFYDFKDDFDMNSKYFFVPQNDSPILQGGLDDSKSPLKVPDKDFLGKNRVLGSAGIDIGAIQKSGNIE